MSLLQLKSISKTFGPNTVLTGIDLEMMAGQIIGLVGESGSGKTTLGRIIVGLEQADEGGNIFFEGFSPGYPFAKELRPKIQFVFQNALGSFNPRQKISESISTPLREFGILKDRQVIKQKSYELMASVELDAGLGDRFPHELSGGQLQRAAFARAIACNPRLLVADEPTSALDASLRSQILHLIKKLRDTQGLSCLVITHDLSSLKLLADHVHVMQKGKMLESGDPAKVLYHPEHPYTQRLIRAIPSLDPAKKTFEHFRNYQKLAEAGKN